MRVVVFGASGFLGSRIRLALDADPAIEEVIPVGRHWQGIDLVTSRLDALVDVLDATQPTAIVNASGRTEGSDEELDAANRLAVVRLLRAVHARRATEPVRFVQLGSAAEYGPGRPDELISEADTPRPTGPYGTSKLRATDVVEEASRARLIDGVVLRVFNPIGAGTPPSTLAGAFARWLLEAQRSGTTAIQTGPLTAVRDFVAVDDVADAVRRAVRGHDLRGLIINIGRGEPVKSHELVHMLMRHAGFDGLIIENAPDSVSGASWQVANRDRAGRTLGWTPTTSLEDATEQLWLELSATPVHV